MVSEISETIFLTDWFQKFLKPFIYRLVSEISETILYKINSVQKFQNHFHQRCDIMDTLPLLYLRQKMSIEIYVLIKKNPVILFLIINVNIP